MGFHLQCGRTIKNSLLMNFLNVKCKCKMNTILNIHSYTMNNYLKMWGAHTHTHFRWLLAMSCKACFFPATSVCFNLHSLGHKPVQCILLSTVVFVLLQKWGKNPTYLFCLTPIMYLEFLCYLYLFLQVFFFLPWIHIQYLFHTNYNFPL